MVIICHFVCICTKKLACLFFPGMAAVNAVLETLQTGDHVVASNQVFSKSFGFCTATARIYSQF